MEALFFPTGASFHSFSELSIWNDLPAIKLIETYHCFDQTAFAMFWQDNYKTSIFLANGKQTKIWIPFMLFFLKHVYTLTTSNEHQYKFNWCAKLVAFTVYHCLSDIMDIKIKM